MCRNILNYNSFRRRIAYWVATVGLIGGYAVLYGATWTGGNQLHTVMEVTATTLAAVVGVMALTRYYSQKDTIVLIVGVGFIGAACLDGYHAIVTSQFFAPYLPSDLPMLIPWSWIASRQFLGIMMCLSWVAVCRDLRTDAGEVNIDRRRRERLTYLLAFTLTIASFAFFAFAPLPRAYFPELFFHRPEEFVPALFFLVALVGFLRTGGWRRSVFEHWLILSLIVDLFGQVAVMSLSSRLFDFEFDVAHLLKIVSYICVLTGLLLNLRAIFKQATAAQNASAQNEQRLRAVFASVADGIITINSKGVVQSINTSAEMQFGYDAGAVIGQNVKMLMLDEHAENHDHDIANYKKTGASSIVGARRDLMGLRKNGSVFPLDLIISEMNIGGERMFTGVIRDTTAAKEAEQKTIRTQNALRRHRDAALRIAKELKRSNAELEQFASVAAHDLQEPLRKVQAFGDRLETKYADKLDERGLDYLTRMQDAAARMQTLISDLLSFSRVASKADPFVSVDLNALARGVLSDLEVSIEECNAQIDIQELPKIDGDPRQLRQVFQNIIGNSLKYRREKIAPKIKITGKIRIEEIAQGQPSQDQTASDLSETPKQICEITVVDNGIGFENEYAEKIFGIFQRLHGRTQYDGTGIGLAICRKIAERHGGTVTATALSGKGATFTITLPVTHNAEQTEYGENSYEAGW